VKLENNYHIPDLVQAFPKKMVGQTGICLSATRTHHFPGKMPIPNQECVVFQLFSLLKTQMVELLIGFVCFCGLSLLNAPWSTVPLLLPLFGSVPTDLV
jgi:hypothetical protein